ncbi:hypothetical protein CBM2587_A20257 [Cupriavidus taiwanensis]|uniref:Uncharacterized protein n=1 Tax=Cupriavidus taiwanensis TaxID=164546 RepID=A0A375BQ91_9BURK|nr:hypothetical protein CBM2587_A20257 [Cupriavidus taiwanensis]
MGEASAGAGCGRSDGIFPHFHGYFRKPARLPGMAMPRHFCCLRWRFRVETAHANARFIAVASLSRLELPGIAPGIPSMKTGGLPPCNIST